MFTLAYNEDPDEMPHHAAFHQGLHCLLRQYMYQSSEKEIQLYLEFITGLPLGGRTAYITSKNRLRTPKLHIKDVPRTSENSLVRPKMGIETSCLQKKPAHIYQIT